MRVAAQQLSQAESATSPVPAAALSSSASESVSADEVVSEPQYSWWQVNDDASVYHDWQQTVDYVKQIFVEQVQSKALQHSICFLFRYVR